jgi:WD40 repeat protein
VLASAYSNGHIVIWDVHGIFQKTQAEATQAARKYSFDAHSGKPCSGIAFSQINHLLLTSCGLDHKIKFFDINVGKEVKKIDINQNTSTNPNQYQ